MCDYDEEQCSTCHGRGEVITWLFQRKKCGACGGTGTKYHVDSDHDRRGDGAGAGGLGIGYGGGGR